MAKKLDCIHHQEDCAFFAEGETDEEVVQVIAAHVKNEHDGQITSELFVALRAGVRDA